MFLPHLVRRDWRGNLVSLSAGLRQSVLYEGIAENVQLHASTAFSDCSVTRCKRCVAECYVANLYEFKLM